MSLSMEQIPPDESLESLYKLRIRESQKLKSVLEWYNLDIYQNKTKPDSHRLKTMVKRGIEHEFRSRNFESRNRRIESNILVKNQREGRRTHKGQEDCWRWQASGQCLKRRPMQLRARYPNAPKFEDRSQKETEWQEHWAREAAWKLAKKILKSKERHKATFFSPTGKWCLFLPCRIRPKEGEFVVDSGASTHMTSRKVLNSAELETVQFGRIPSTVVTANGKEQTHEEAAVYVKGSDILDCKNPRGYASSVIAWKASRGSRVFI